MEATKHCRENASLFDVSHMCGLTLKVCTDTFELCCSVVAQLSQRLLLQGKDAVPFLEKLVVGDVKGIENGSGSLSVFTNEKGGIIDDTVVTKARPG